ncbi:hypothetical protein AB205_0088020 [Aquarana catesbeiana]|uniref:Uncharacterized protein n=1 Tax=Aquarana catesbeiana TaxID=8400 RepID=A0A2G9RZH0_AQUCT|nr:hypothetical protein AB205_0088020 [Aquarana catesbeiana]
MSLLYWSSPYIGLLPYIQVSIKVPPYIQVPNRAPLTSGSTS